jgi:tape measure domain-containing protein
MSGILIDVNARTTSAEHDLANVNQSLKNIEKSTKQTSEALGGMMKTIAGLAASALSVSYLKGISNEFAAISNQISLVTGRTNELITTQIRLGQIARDTRSTLTGTATAFSSLGRSMKRAGASTDSLILATRTIQQAVSLSNASAEGAAGALMQLGQGLASGTLRGDELNSVMEQTSVLAQAIADGLGVGIGQLRTLGEAGKLTSQQVFGALVSQSKQMNAQFQQMVPTLNQGFTAFSESIKSAFNELDRGLRFTDIFASGLAKAAGWVSRLSDGAFEFAAGIRSAVSMASRLTAIVGAPLLRVIDGVGKAFVQMIPSLFITTTLKRTLASAATLLDMALGAPMVELRNAWLWVWDIGIVRSNVSKALFELGKLNPTHWVGFGMNLGTVIRLFRIDPLVAYGKAFSNLADAIEKDSHRWFQQVSWAVTQTMNAMDKLKIFFGFKPDYFFMSLARGFSGDLTSAIVTVLRRWKLPNRRSTVTSVLGCYSDHECNGQVENLLRVQT